MMGESVDDWSDLVMIRSRKEIDAAHNLDKNLVLLIDVSGK